MPTDGVVTAVWFTSAGALGLLISTDPTVDANTYFSSDAVTQNLIAGFLIGSGGQAFSQQLSAQVLGGESVFISADGAAFVNLLFEQSQLI